MNALTSIWCGVLLIALPMSATAGVEGACCFESGDCVIGTESECTTDGGVFQGEGSSCDPNPCPQLGACCLEEVCFVLNEYRCFTLGGSYVGDGSRCDPLPCPVLGACCLLNGDCVLVTSGECRQYLGEYRGDYTACEPDLCPAPVPNHIRTWGCLKSRYRAAADR